MVDERFCSPRRLGHRESLQNVGGRLGPVVRAMSQKGETRKTQVARARRLLGTTHVREDLFDETEVRFLVKLLVKDDDRSRTLEAVSGHLHLVHRVRVQDVEPDRGPVRSLCGPEVQVVVLPPRFEKEGVVARREVAQFVDRREVVLVFEFRLCSRFHGSSESAFSLERSVRVRGPGTDPFWRGGGGRASPS
jgi:hypothetical protein